MDVRFVANKARTQRRRVRGRGRRASSAPMACPCLPSESEELEGFDPTIALECSQLAMCLAYEPDVGFRVASVDDARQLAKLPAEFDISTSGIVFTKDYERDGKRALIVCCRGTLFGVAKDMLRNLSFKKSANTIFKGYNKEGQLVFEGLKGLADEKVHRQYLDRAMGCLFSYLLLVKMKAGGEGAYDIGKYEKVIVTGHSQGGAVAQVFAALLVGMDKGLRDLRDGYIDTLEINDWSGSVNIFGASKTELTSSKLTITMTTNADGADVFDVKWSGASRGGAARLPRSPMRPQRPVLALTPVACARQVRGSMKRTGWSRTPCSRTRTRTTAWVPARP